MGRYAARRIRDLTPNIAALIEHVDEVLSNDGEFTQQELADAARTVAEESRESPQAELPL